MRNFCLKYLQCLRLKYIRSFCKLYESNLYIVECLSKVDIFKKNVILMENIFFNNI